MHFIVRTLVFILIITIVSAVFSFIVENVEYMPGCLGVSIALIFSINGCSMLANMVPVSTHSIESTTYMSQSQNAGSSRTSTEATVSDSSTEMEVDEVVPNSTKRLTVGVDIPFGIYKLTSIDSSNKIVRVLGADGSILVGEEDFRNSAYVEVKDGQILEFSDSLDCTPIEEVEPTDCPTYLHGYDLDGWYRVGLDLPPGHYTIYWGSGNYGMYGVYKTVDLPWIQLKDAVGGVVYDSEPDEVNFSDGEFIWFSRCRVLIEPNGTTGPYEEPAPVEEPIQTRSAPVTTDRRERTVYITANGYRYHNNKHCRGLNNANDVYSVTLGEAEDRGFTPCKICH